MKAILLRNFSLFCRVIISKTMDSDSDQQLGVDAMFRRHRRRREQIRRERDAEEARRIERQPRRTTTESGSEYVYAMLSNPNGAPLFEMCRMSKDPFIAIVGLIRQFLPPGHISAEESFMMFMKVLAHSDRNRVVQDRFNHSGETVSRHFGYVLDAITHLTPNVIKHPGYTTTPPEIVNNPKYWPWFKVSLMNLFYL